MAVEQIKLQDTTVLDQAQLQLLSISISFPRKSVKQENKFKLPLHCNTGFNDKVEIQLLILQFCFSRNNIIWEKLDTLHKTKPSCPSGPSSGPVVNVATYCSEQEERKGNTHYYSFSTILTLKQLFPNLFQYRFKSQV